jgi:hypothetical protein
MIKFNFDHKTIQKDIESRKSKLDKFKPDYDETYYFGQHNNGDKIILFTPIIFEHSFLDGGVFFITDTRTKNILDKIHFSITGTTKKNFYNINKQEYEENWETFYNSLEEKGYIIENNTGFTKPHSIKEIPFNLSFNLKKNKLENYYNDNANLFMIDTITRTKKLIENIFYQESESEYDLLGIDITSGMKTIILTYGSKGPYISYADIFIISRYDQANFFYTIGEDLFKNKKIEEAIQYYDKAIYMDTAYEDAIYKRIICYTKFKNINECIINMEHLKILNTLKSKELILKLINRSDLNSLKTDKKFSNYFINYKRYIYPQ